MFCSNCGNEIKDFDHFCSKCGHQVKTNIESNYTSDNTSHKKPAKKNESGIWSFIIVISLIGIAFFTLATVAAFIDGMSSSSVSPSSVSPSDISSIDISNKYYEIIVDSHGDYEYSRSSNENIMVNCYFDVTNIGTGSADNVQVDYSLLFDGRVLETSTLYLGTISAGSNSHREKGHSVTLNSFEWNDLVDEEEKIEISIDETRAE